MDEVRQFQARDGDIAICTFPKCGTTWMNAIIEMLTHAANPECLHDGKSLEWKNPYLELTDPDWAEERRPVRLLAKLPPDTPRTYFTHLGYDALPETVKKNAKIVFVVRNPKDTIVSMYHFNRSHYPLQFHGDLQEMINGFTEDRVTYGPFFDHTASYWSRRNDRNIFCTSFEELSLDFLGVIRRLAKFLGKDLTEDQLRTTMYECAFDQMKNNDTVNKAAVGARGYFDFNKSPFIRAGKTSQPSVKCLHNLEGRQQT
ncbi:hypothetical protein RvY_07966-2 [Ramazzottius varieornatus]|uniref:Sulfotransferase domain-containing protein n=1 Tax=Ramazzottius varieornatus TaxID=947166 RepID=A0A1D1V454_RAMVA|nr:hypothetical protein RvY_07966-2 [Ramazzottius varieornatus]